MDKKTAKIFFSKNLASCFLGEQKDTASHSPDSSLNSDPSQWNVTQSYCCKRRERSWLASSLQPSRSKSEVPSNSKRVFAPQKTQVKNRKCYNTIEILHWNLGGMKELQGQTNTLALLSKKGGSEFPPNC